MSLSSCLYLATLPGFQAGLTGSRCGGHRSRCESPTKTDDCVENKRSRIGFLVFSSELRFRELLCVLNLVDMLVGPDREGVGEDRAVCCGLTLRGFEATVEAGIND